MKTDEKYEIAQSFQQKYWQKGWEKDPERQQKAKSRWGRLVTTLKEEISLKPETKILDLGCGPCGIIGSFETGERYALDPLIDYYLSHFDMPKGIKWVKGIGESIPFEDNYFDVVITMDTLDHVKDPEVVLRELRRVLKRGGSIFLSVNVSRPFTRAIKTIHQKIGISSPATLHFFTAKRIEKMLTHLGFRTKKGWHDVIDLEVTTGPSDGFMARLKKNFQKATRIASEHGFREGVKFTISFLTGGRSYQGDFLIIAAKQELK